MPLPDTCKPLLIAAILPLAAASCGTDANPVRDLAIASGVTGGEPRPAPDFVTRSRPASVEYTPIGVAPPARRFRAKDKAKVETAEKEMNELRSSNEARAARARRAAGSSATPVPAKPAN